jgi:hypothetical protein
MRVGRFDSRDLRAGRALIVLLSIAAIGGIVASAFLVWVTHGKADDELRARRRHWRSPCNGCPAHGRFFLRGVPYADA